jgi:UDP-GlcNAc:undecaprenyl-phosphate GlcNAc-1-phosphate transferase
MEIVPFIAAYILSVITIPIVREFCFRTGKVYMPRKDRWHIKPTPTLGGVAMFIAFAGAIFLFGFVNHSTSHWPWQILIASAIMFVLGIVDDFKPINPPTKFITQLIASGIVIYFGDFIHFFPWPIANIVLTLLWLVGIIWTVWQAGCLLSQQRYYRISFGERETNP